MFVARKESILKLALSNVEKILKTVREEFTPVSISELMDSERATKKADAAALTLQANACKSHGKIGIRNHLGITSESPRNHLGIVGFRH